MKRLIASILAISVAACIPTGCSTTDNTAVSSSVTTTEETSTAASTTETPATEPTTPTGPRYVLEEVDSSMTQLTLRIVLPSETDIQSGTR